MDNENSSPQYFRWQNDSLYLDLLVQTYASHDEIVGVHGNRLKVRLSASPVAGNANDHLIKVMAEYYGVPYNRVHLIKGHQSRMKQICVQNPQANLPHIEPT
ncbi:MAG: YggU family protein [Proteobacteria bacterium]|nr:YggU family protein [Pseudomonadota bacterium]